MMSHSMRPATRKFIAITALWIFLILSCGGTNHLAFGSRELTTEILWCLPLVVFWAARNALSGKQKQIFTIVLAPIVIWLISGDLYNAARLIGWAPNGERAPAVVHSDNVGGHIVQCVRSGEYGFMTIQEKCTIFPGLYWIKEISQIGYGEPNIKIIDNNTITFMRPDNVWLEHVDERRITYRFQDNPVIGHIDRNN